MWSLGLNWNSPSLPTLASSDFCFNPSYLKCPIYDPSYCLHSGAQKYRDLLLRKCFCILHKRIHGSRALYCSTQGKMGVLILTTLKATFILIEFFKSPICHLVNRKNLYLNISPPKVNKIKHILTFWLFIIKTRGFGTTHQASLANVTHTFISWN